MMKIHFLLILSTLFISLSIFGQAEPEGLLQEATSLRKFLHEVVESSGQKGDEAKAIGMKKALAQHPEILKWIIEGKDLGEIAKKADLPPVESEIFSYLEKINDYGGSLKGKAPVEILSNYGRWFLAGQLGTLTAAQGEGFLKNIPNPFFSAMAKKIDKSIEETKFSQTPMVKVLTDPQKGMDLSKAPKQMADFFQLVMNKYFDRLPLEDKRKIILGLLELPPTATQAQKLSSILNNAGPALQKTFQLLGNDVKSPMVAEVMAELKSNIKPFSFEEAKGIIKKETGKEIHELFDSFREKHLAAATVGQVYLAKIGDQEVIVKIMRPGLREKARREIDLLRELAPNQGIKQVVDRLEESLFSELDFTDEAKNLEKGQIYSEGRRNFKVVKPIAKIPATQNLLVMEKAVGKTMDKTSDEDMHLKGEALQEFLGVWFKEAVFKSGFFHGDLHAGNIFFQPERFKAYLPMQFRPTEFERSTMTLIDFGAVGQFTFKERKALLKLLLGTTFNSTTSVVETFATFHNMGEADRKKFTTFVAETLAKVEDPSESLNLIMNKAIEMNFNIPKNLILFNRGRAFLEKQIEEVNKKMDQLDPLKKRERYSIIETYRSIVLRNLSKDMVYSLLGIQEGEEGLMDRQTLGTLVDDYFYPKSIDGDYLDCWTDPAQFYGTAFE